MNKINLLKDREGETKLIEVVKSIENPLWDGTIENWFDSLKYSQGTLELFINVPVPSKNTIFKNEFLQYIKKGLERVNGIKNIDLHLNTSITSGITQMKGLSIEKAKNIIAIASNKGGVGKSTIAYNLACALQKIDSNVAILDLDIYGPSLPTMFGIKKEVKDQKDKLIPIKKYDLDLMSFGFIEDDSDTPMIFRAPVIDKIANQFFREVKWNEVDYLIIDLPPGTGDMQLTLTQELPYAQMVMVTTPNNVSQSDVNKGIRMFTQESLNVNVLGIIENMSYFVCDECNTKHDIFDVGGGKDIADTFDIEFLAQFPLYTDLRISSDKGLPIVLSKPDHEVSKKFIELAELISARIAQNNNIITQKKEKQVVIDLDII